MKFILVFLGSAFLLLLFFYFYPAHIFEAKVTGSGNELIMDLSLKNIFFKTDLPSQLNVNNISSIRMTLSGYMILFICTLGLPLMIAYRATMKKPTHNNETKTEN